MTLLKHLFCLFLLLFMVACAAPQNTLTVPLSGANLTDQSRWWRVYDDPLMDLLVAQLLDQNLNLKIAAARLEEVEAVATRARSTLYPDVAVSGTATRNNTEGREYENRFRLGLDATYNLDLFGRNRAAVEAATARVNAQAAAVDVAQQSLIATVVRTVIDYRRTVATIGRLDDLKAQQSEQVQLIASRLEQGLIDAALLERARASLIATEALLPPTYAQAMVLQHQLEALLAQEPESLRTVLADFAQQPMVVPSSASYEQLPLQQLRQRASIRVSAAQLVAARADLAGAEAALWPDISLAAFLGIQEASSGMLAADNPLSSISANLTAPLLNFDRLRSDMRAADARTQQAALSYEQAVIEALQQTRSAYVRHAWLLQQLNDQQRVVDARQQTVQLAEERYRIGLTSMVDLVTAQNEKKEAELNLIQTQADVARAYADLQEALGTPLSTPD